MMKGKFLTHLLIIYLLTVLNSVGAQNYSSSIDFLGGYAENGVGGKINYNYYFDSDQFIQLGVFISASKDEVKGIKIPYNDFTINLGYFKSFKTGNSKSLKITIGFGALGGYEAINNGENFLSNGGELLDKSKFIYGAFASGGLDFYLNDDWSLILNATEFYHHNSDLGKLTPFFGAGLRYFLF